MKKFYAILCIAIASLTQLHAQAPQGFNYQATVRNSSGDLIVNTNVYFKFNVIQGSQTAVPIFSETHYVPTDDLGQVNLVIGQGTTNIGAFSELDWSLGSYYLGIELDTGNGYVAMGTTQLLSVPYAMYAESSGSSSSGFPTGGTEGQVLSIVSGAPTWTDVSGFTDSENLAEITTVEASNIDFESMISGGNINNDGGFTVVSKGVIWSESPNPTPELETKTDEGGGASSFTSTITGLDEETEYFYRAYTTTSAGTAYGSTYVFITDSSQFYDQDGDGFNPDQGDCDDFDATISPNAVEVCDGIDNNCDGVVDEELLTNFYQDSDGDGFGGSITIQSCTQPSGYVVQGGDCDDFDFTINPNAAEILNNGIDDDCDGDVDCIYDIGGMYTVTTTYGYHDFLPDNNPITKEVEITALGDGNFSVADFSGGLWPDVYSPVYSLGDGYFPLVFNNNCGIISWSGQQEVWGNIIPLEGGTNGVDSNGVVTISWYAEGYGENGVSVYTPL
tara:strand:- start:1790 stop:3301 length:1512 start_codon:yes stop_codon:yes gene_type:complete